MIFNNLGEILSIIHVLESPNTLICITDIDNNIVYESSKNDCKQKVHLDDPKKLAATLQLSTNASFKIVTLDHQVTALTTVPISICNQPYFLELKQFITPFNSKSYHFDDISICKMKELVITDSLTTLYNRRYIDERLPIDMLDSYKLNEPFSILFIDIDYFKRINDKNGHAAGDQILQELARLLKKQLCYKNGWIARYGGDEMLISLPGCPKEIAKRIAHRFRKAIENNIFYIKDKKVKITCSIGVETVLKDTEVHTISELMIMADKNLYRAKNEGRNRVI
jgi:two-component system cell cycle response regulator